MKLYSVKTVDVLGVPNGLYSFAKSETAAHERVLITGPSGSGKTRFLDLLVEARQLLSTGHRSEDEVAFIQPGNESCKVILSWELTPDDQETIDAPTPIVSTELIFQDQDEEEVDSRVRFLMERYGHDDDTPKFEYFSEKRRLDVGGGGARLDEDDQYSLRMTSSPRKWSWVPTFLATLPDEQRKAMRFASVVERMSATCTYDLHRGALTSRGRVVRQLSELSASEADAVGFGATAALVGLSNSIVLVDRPELHGLDPLRALGGLAALGRDNQLILASPSPALAAGFDGVVVQLGSATQEPRGEA